MADTAVELKAIQTLVNTLEPLDDQARARVVGYAVAILDINASTPAKPLGSTPAKAATGEETDDGSAPLEVIASAQKYASFAELFDAAGAHSNADKALVAGYWLQICVGAESFSGQAANNELKNLGEAVANITNAVDSLKNQRPALALQLRKSGKSQQARKAYKITVAGIKAVEAMINGQ